MLEALVACPHGDEQHRLVGHATLEKPHQVCCYLPSFRRSWMQMAFFAQLNENGLEGVQVVRIEGWVNV